MLIAANVLKKKGKKVLGDESMLKNGKSPSNEKTYDDTNYDELKVLIILK